MVFLSLKALFQTTNNTWVSFAAKRRPDAAIFTEANQGSLWRRKVES
jgi:hypothetical protein